MSSKFIARYAGIALAAGFVVAICCLAQAIPLGISGSPKVRLWLALFFAAIVWSLIFGLIYYAHRARPPKSNEEIAVEALAAAGAHMRQENPPIDPATRKP